MYNKRKKGIVEWPDYQITVTLLTTFKMIRLLLAHYVKCTFDLTLTNDAGIVFPDYYKNTVS